MGVVVDVVLVSYTAQSVAYPIRHELFLHVATLPLFFAFKTGPHTQYRVLTVIHFISSIFGPENCSTSHPKGIF
jgi:hypothetical protein